MPTIPAQDKLVLRELGHERVDHAGQVAVAAVHSPLPLVPRECPLIARPPAPVIFSALGRYGISRYFADAAPCLTMPGAPRAIPQ